MSALKQEVLRAFKSLHRACMSKFEGDTRMLTAAREKINEEFKKHKHITSQTATQELIKVSREAENEIRTSLVQVKEIRPGHHEVKITPETTKLENFPYRDVPEEELRRRKPRKPCSEK
ncbi:unnamed protein product [Bemisia tabaci]|uniref:Complex III assembly factor LYRM7 n=1 Tax=Bemisia tabaci TaxID=7038 RepID=A0A9P0A2G3_BEMTA|nr:unnamed protein product [Bemisia tabaci]